MWHGNCPLFYSGWEGKVDYLCDLRASTILVNPYPVGKISSANFIVCYNFQCASKSFKFGENFARMSNSLDRDDTPSYSASRPNPSWLSAYGTVVAIGRIRVIQEVIPGRFYWSDRKGLFKKLFPEGFTGQIEKGYSRSYFRKVLLVR